MRQVITVRKRRFIHESFIKNDHQWEIRLFRNLTLVVFEYARDQHVDLTHTGAIVT